MVIYEANGTPIIDIKVDDSSYRYEEIMGDCNVYLEFALTEHIEVEPGSYIMFQGVKYELLSRESVTIQHTRNYEYKATFSGPQARFSRYIMYNYQDGRVKFEMIARPVTLMEMVLWNLNNREPGVWSLGSYVDKEEQLVSFNHTNLWDALNLIAAAFDTEWGVETYGGGYRINLRKNEFNKNSPLSLGYGKNQGFKPGVGRLNYGDFGQVEKVWIEGGDRNLSLEEYGWTTLHFPRSFAFSIDAQGHYYYWEGPVPHRESGYDSSTALDFVTDEFGASVRLASASSSCIEASLDLTEYYPKRVGTVTDVRYLYNGQYLPFNELIELDDIDWNAVEVDIIDSTIGDSGLDYSECQFSNDEPLTIIFQSGMLMGREFNATFVKEPMTQPVIDPETGEPVIDPTTGEAQRREVRPANRFELSRATIDGVDMPNYTFRPNATSNGGVVNQDSYIVVNCWLPLSYVCDYDAFSGAELEALREAAKFIRDNKDPQFTFKGQVDDLYAKRNWGTIHDKLILGGCISFQNSSIQPTPIVTRILGIKTFVNNPYAPELTLSNETAKGGMSSTLAKLRADDEHIIEGVKQARRYSQRSFRDAKETIAMLAGTIDYFSEGINPITVETMSLLVGYEALQFRFFASRLCNPPTVDPVHYDADARSLTLDACVIQHMTHGINGVTSSTNPNGTPVRKYYDYLRWSMERVVFGPTYFIGNDPLTGNSLADTAYYLYAKVDAANVAKMDSEMTAEEAAHIGGEFVLTTEKKQIKERLTAVEGYFYLLVGILNSEHEGGRSFAPLYGFTEVLPGQITTDVIRSAGGDSYFDLVNNQFALGDSLTFINNTLTLSGAFVQKGDGTYTNIGSWCGQWTAGIQYAPGDEVWWQAPNGTISSYRYIYPTPTRASADNDPSHTNYWQVYAQGVAGASGDTGQSSFTSTMFVRMNGTPTKPGNNDGSFANPAPTGILAGQDSTGTNVYWEDGIPAGAEILWATTRVFTSDGQSPQESSWHTPRQMTDTETYDVEFAYKQTNDATPPLPTDANRHGGSGTQIWFDPSLDTSEDYTQMYWRAERECLNGEWGDWVILRIKGENGADGNGIDRVEVYYNFGANSSTPPGSWPYAEGVRPSQSGHSGEYFWTKTVIIYTDTSKPDKVTCTAQYIPSNGTSGADGDPGPMLVYRGRYNMNAQGEYDLDYYGSIVPQTYYGNEKRRDVIWYNNIWWMALDVRTITHTTNGAFSDIKPDSASGSSYWTSFESNVANIATGLLLANKAFIDNAIVRYLQTYDPDHPSAMIKAEKDWMKMYDTNGVARLEITGEQIDLDSADELFPTSGNGFRRIYNGDGDSGTDSGSIEVCTFTLGGTSSDSFTVNIPAIQIEMNKSALYDGDVDVTYLRTYIADENGGLIYSIRQWNSTQSSYTTSSLQRTMSGGATYKIITEMSWGWECDATSAPSGSIDTVSVEFVDDSDANIIIYNSTENIVRIGANGISISLINSFAAIFGIETVNQVSSPVIRLQGISNGNQVGVRITSANGLQINTGNGWKTPLTS